MVSRLPKTRIVLGILAAVLGAATLLAAPAHADRLPVTYDFFAGVRDELAHPGGSAPGSNDFRCRPSAAHPNPVILVHGTGGNRQTNWATTSPALKNAGYCVFALTYGALPGTPWPVNALGGFTAIEQSAQQLAQFVTRVRTATGAAQVDLVGHSEGTFMPGYYVKFLGGARYVDHYVSLAPYWKGQDSSGCRSAKVFTDALGVPWPYPECQQEDYNSAFLQKLWQGGTPYVPGIAYTNIVSEHDAIVVPYTDGLVAGEGVRNIVLQRGCPQDRSDHLRIVANPRAVALVQNALDPQHPQPVPCLAAQPVL